MRRHYTSKSSFTMPRPKPETMRNQALYKNLYPSAEKCDRGHSIHSTPLSYSYIETESMGGLVDNSYHRRGRSRSFDSFDSDIISSARWLEAITYSNRGQNPKGFRPRQPKSAPFRLEACTLGRELRIRYWLPARA